MKSRRLLFAASLAILTLLSYSCGDDKDTTDTTGPKITLKSPSNDDAFHIGDRIDISFDMEDESGINNYKIDIHWGEDHEHKSASSGTRISELPETKVWSYQKVFDDKKGQKNAEILISTDQIPDNTKGGHYHLGILATDLSGNETRKYIEITIEDDEH